MDKERDEVLDRAGTLLEQQIEARAAKHRPDEEVLAEELARYGIPESAGLEGLLRHVYANRDMVFAFNRITTDGYKEQRDAVKALMNAAGPDGVVTVTDLEAALKHKAT